jgi:hypothetical protein
MTRSRIPLTRSLLLHTGGAMWLDAAAFTASRINHEHYLQWLPGSPTIELGLVSAAVQSLVPEGPFAREPLSHFMLSLASLDGRDAPTGTSAQLIAAAATLWCQYTSQREEQPLVLAGSNAPESTPFVVLTGSGSLVQARTDSGLNHYEFADVQGWPDKLEQLDLALAEHPVLAIHLFCPHTQLESVRELLLAIPDRRVLPGEDDYQLRYGPDRASLRLHPVTTVDDLAHVLMGLAGVSEEHDLVQQLETLRALRDQRHAHACDSDDLDMAIRRIGQRLRDGSPLRAGDILNGRFQLTEVSGRGGLAEVWRAYDLHRLSVVAIRVLLGRYKDDRSRLQRFTRGAHEMARLRHPHIVQVIEEHQRQGPHHYCVMEYMPGGTLHQSVIGEQMTTEHAMECMFHVGDALAYVHRQGLLHRDIKPHNILLDRNQSASLGDFDLVRALDTIDTQSGAFGSLGYMDPRLSDDRGLPDQRSDIYSLAMTCVFVLNRRDVSPRARLVELLADIDSRALRRVLTGALDDEVEQRKYRAVDDFMRDLRAAWNAAQNCRSPGIPIPVPDVDRPFIGWGWVLLLVVLILTGIILRRVVSSSIESPDAPSATVVFEPRTAPCGELPPPPNEGTSAHIGTSF